MTRVSDFVEGGGDDGVERNPVPHRPQRDRDPCGHHPSLIVRSVESEYQFCELCEARSERNDALKMEEHYRYRSERLEAALREVTSQTIPGDRDYGADMEEDWEGDGQSCWWDVGIDDEPYKTSVAIDDFEEGFCILVRRARAALKTINERPDPRLAVGVAGAVGAETSGPDEAMIERAP